jgi:L-amino acid N-acyltransferase YncA
MRIGFLGPADRDAVARIYAEGIATRQATFETQVPAGEAWNAAHLPRPRLMERRSPRVGADLPGR